MRKTHKHIESAGRDWSLVAAAALALLLSGCVGREMLLRERAPRGTELVRGIDLFEIYRAETSVRKSGAGPFYTEEGHFLTRISEEDSGSYGVRRLDPSGSLGSSRRWPVNEGQEEG
jgi:hypothetical protein